LVSTGFDVTVRFGAVEGGEEVIGLGGDGDEAGLLVVVDSEILGEAPSFMRKDGFSTAAHAGIRCSDARFKPIELVFCAALDCGAAATGFGMTGGGVAVATGLGGGAGRSEALDVAGSVNGANIVFQSFECRFFKVFEAPAADDVLVGVAGPFAETEAGFDGVLVAVFAKGAGVTGLDVIVGAVGDVDLALA